MIYLNLSVHSVYTYTVYTAEGVAYVSVMAIGPISVHCLPYNQALMACLVT